MNQVSICVSEPPVRINRDRSPRRPDHASCALVLTRAVALTPAVLLALLLAQPRTLGAQGAVDPPPDEAEALPEGLAAAETARSRRCVPVLGRLEVLNADLDPLARRTARLRTLYSAVALEDTTRVTPFDPDDALEQAVLRWHLDDLELARRYLANPDESIQDQRTEGRELIQAQLQEAAEAVNARVHDRIAASGDLPMAARECRDAILILSVVLEECGTLESAVCTDARATEPAGRFAFVEAPEDLWGVESLQAWRDPARIGPTLEGELAGGSTGALVRRGNVILTVGIEPVIRRRSALPEAELAEADARMDSLGVTFDHPEYVLIPAVVVELEVGQPLGGESHYLLHFGGLSDPVADIIWTVAAGDGRPVRVLLPARKITLDRLAAGEEVALTAMRFPQEGLYEGDAVYSLALPTFGQQRAVSALLDYMTSGRLASDFSALVPPDGAP